MGAPSKAMLASAVLSASACADVNPDDLAAWAGPRDSVANVEVVQNPEAPLFEADRVAVSELWRATDTGPQGIWESPAAVAVGTGMVFVLDRQAHSVYVLDESTGEDLRTIGREGGGPGEFERPFGVGVVEGRLVVGNSGGPRIDVFGVDGTYERSLRINFLPFGLEAFADGPLILTGLESGSRIRRLIDLRGDVEPYEPADISVVDSDLSFDACPRWGAGPTGLLRGHCRRLAFQQIALDGDVLREVHVDRPPELASQAELNAYEEIMRQSLAQTNIPAAEANAFINDQIAEARVKAIYVRVRGDLSTDRVYVQEQTPPDLGVGPASLNVFDADGRYLARLEFERPWRDFRVFDDRVFALTVDPGTELAALIAYELDFSDAGSVGRP